MLSNKVRKSTTVQPAGSESASMPDWLTSAQAAQLCGTLTGHTVSLNTFRRHIMKKVRIRRLGFRLLVSKPSVEEYCRNLDDPEEYNNATPARGKPHKKNAAKG